MTVAVLKELNNAESWSKEKSILYKLIKEEGTKIKDAAAGIGVHYSGISQYLGSGYKGNVNELENKIRKYLKQIGLWEEDSLEEPDGLEKDFIKSIEELKYIITQDAQRTLGICRMCHTKNEFGLVVGAPGTGKTRTIERYSESNPNVHIITCDETSTKKSILVSVAEIIGAKKYGSSASIMDDVVKILKKQIVPCLLVFDEADILGLKELETIRSLYDKSKNIGVLLCGNELLAEKILFYAEDKPELARLRDRIGVYQKLSGITEIEANEFLENVNCNVGAKRSLVKIITKRGIRQFRMALGRLLDVTQGDIITEELVQELGQIVLSFNA